MWGRCTECGQAFNSGREFKTHQPCGPFAGQEITVHSHRTYAQWDDGTAVEVHVDPKTGQVRYPARHGAPLKEGYERQYLRSLHEVEKFEQAHQVRSEMAWFDKGSGRGHDDTYRGERYTH